MFLLIFAVIIAVPLIEIYFVVKIGSVVGVVPTIALLFVISVFGSRVVKHQGLRVWRKFNEQVSSGNVPSRELVEGVCLLLAGALLIAPGFFTDLLGFLLLLPPVRLVVAKIIGARTANKAQVIRATYGKPIVDIQEHRHDDADNATRELDQ
ncbi:MAG: FxsA family protein [Ilumatobacteraceae bacterium]|nr:FxsA family protein [Ilumatobacteraceae bacterium]